MALLAKAVQPCTCSVTKDEPRVVATLRPTIDSYKQQLYSLTRNRWHYKYILLRSKDANVILLFAKSKFEIIRATLNQSSDA